MEQRAGTKSTAGVCVVGDRIVWRVRIQRRNVGRVQVESERSRVASGEGARNSGLLHQAHATGRVDRASREGVCSCDAEGGLRFGPLQSLTSSLSACFLQGESWREHGTKKTLQMKPFPTFPQAHVRTMAGLYKYLSGAAIISLAGFGDQRCAWRAQTKPLLCTPRHLSASSVLARTRRARLQRASSRGCTRLSQAAAGRRE
jgi:hypothetical protein